MYLFEVSDRNLDSAIQRAISLRSEFRSDPIFVAVGNAKAGFDSGLGSAIHLQGQLTFRKLILLPRELRHETRTGAPISVVHTLSPRLWASAIAIGAALNAPTLCDTDNSAPSVLALGTWNVRLLLRAFKPVMVTPTEAGRAPVPSSVPSVVVPEIAHDSPCARYAPLHALYARRRLERASSPHFLAINARYESRPTTGVERFAQETTTRMSRPIARFAPSRLYSRGPAGHLWEQIVLPLRLAPYRCHLWSPCNFGPIARPRSDGHDPRHRACRSSRVVRATIRTVVRVRHLGAVPQGEMHHNRLTVYEESSPRSLGTEGQCGDRPARRVRFI